MDCSKEKEIKDIVTKVSSIKFDMEALRRISELTCGDVKRIDEVLEDNGQPGMRTTVIRTAVKVEGIERHLSSLVNTLKWIAVSIILPVGLFIIDRAMSIISEFSETAITFRFLADIMHYLL